MLRVIHHKDPEWVPDGLESFVMLYPPYVARPAKAGRDSFGVRYDLEEQAEGGTYPAPGGNTITNLGRWREEITIPDVELMDWSKVTVGWSGEPIALDEIDRDAHLVCGILEFGLFERSYLLMGMEEALVAYVTARDLMKEMVSALADFYIAVIARFHEVADLDMVWYGDDWGTQSGLFLPPKVWRHIIKPHTQRIYECMKERGILVNQHSCGRIESIFADMVEMGADVWNPCQPCNDLAALKREYGGQITFCGGIDSQFVLDRPGVTAAEVRAEVRKRIDEMATGGGYIAAPSHSVRYDPRVLAAMKDEIVSYGRYQTFRKVISSDV